LSDRWTQHNMDKCGVAWFKMNEASGKVLDSKGSFVGTATNVSYNQKEGMYFNGTNSYVAFSNKIIPRGKKSIYLEVKLVDSNAWATILGNTRGYNYSGFRIELIDDKIKIYITREGDSNTGIILGLKGTVNLRDGQWHKILFTCTGDTAPNGCKLYIDDMTTPNVQGSFKYLEKEKQTQNLQIGRRAYHNDAYFKGFVRNIQIYNDVIDPISKYYFIQTNDNKIWTYNTTWQDTGMVIGDLDYTNVSAKSNFETYGMFADENLSSQALQDLKEMGYTSYRVLMGKM